MRGLTHHSSGRLRRRSIQTLGRSQKLNTITAESLDSFDGASCHGGRKPSVRSVGVVAASIGAGCVSGFAIFSDRCMLGCRAV